MFKNRNGDEINAIYAQSRGSLSVNWGIQNCGFGQLHVYENKENGKMMFDTEYMYRNSVKAILCKMVDDGVFTDFEDLVKTSTELTKQEINDLYVFAKPGTMYFTLPFYMEVCEDDKNILELRFNGTKNSVIAIYLSLSQVKLISDQLTKKYKEENLARQNNEEIVEDDNFVVSLDNVEQSINEEITAESVDIFSYGLYVQKRGFDSEFIKAEKWTWEIVSKEEDEPSPQLELDLISQEEKLYSKENKSSDKRFNF